MRIKKTTAFLIIFLMLYVPIFFIAKNSGININEISGFKLDKQLEYDDYYEAVGYKIKGNHFVLEEEDPRIIYTKIDMDLESIQIRLEKPLENILNIQVYYVAEGGNLIESNSVFVFAHEGDTEIYIDVPKIERCSILRFDLDGDFVLESIQLSKDDFVIENQGKSQVSIWAYVIWAFIVLLISWLIVFKLDVIYETRKKINFLRKVKISGLINKRTFFYVAVIIAYIVAIIYNINKFDNNKYKYMCQTILLSVILLLLLQGRKIKERIAGITFFIIVFVGMCYTYTLPIATMVGPDDEIHYERAVDLSHFFDKMCSEADEMIYNRKFLIEYNQDEIKQRANKLQDLYINGKAFEITPISTNIYERMAYIPTAAGMFIARGLGCSFIHIFLAGKAANFITYAIIVYFALKKLKSCKLILSVIALFPTNIFLACSYSYDVWVTGFSMLAISYIISSIQTTDEKMCVSDMVVILSAFVIGFSPKAIYFPIALLALLIPKNRFKEERVYKEFLLAVFICTFIILASFMLPFLVQGPGTGDARGGSDVNSTEQVKFILTQPIEYTKILFGHLIKYLSIGRQAATIADFAYLDSSNHFVLYCVILITAIFTDRDKCDIHVNTLKNKVFCLGLLFLTVVLISTALYVSFTPVAHSVINGCQYRYLMPLIFPLAYFILNMEILNKANKNVLYIICILCMIFCLFDDARNRWIDSYKVNTNIEIQTKINQINNQPVTSTLWNDRSCYL